MAGNDPLVQDANIRDSIPGLSFRADYPLNVAAGRSAAANVPVLTSATNPAITDIGTGNVAVSFAANDNTTLLLNWEIPGEYDPDADELKVILVATDQTGNDSAPTLAVSVARFAAPIAASQLYPNSSAVVGGTGYAAYVASTEGAQTVPISGASVRLTYTFTGVGFKPGDGCMIKVTPAAHTSDPIWLICATARIRRHAALRYMPDRF